MGLSTNTYTYSGGSKQFSATFADGYIEQSHVTAYVVGAVDGLGDQVYLNFTWTSESQITVTDSLTVGDEVTVERTVPKDNVLVDLDENGAITREGLARNNRQALHAVHEVIDGRLENSLITAVNELVARVNEIDASVAAAAGSASTASAAAAAALASANEAAAVANSAATLLREATITGDGAATYSLTHDLPVGLVFIDGVQQNFGAFTHDQAGREITFAEAVPTGAEIEVLYSAGTAAYSLLTFEDADSFFANTTISYTNTVVGSTVVSRKDGYSWRVAPAVSNEQDFTLNGIKYYVNPVGGAYYMDAWPLTNLRPTDSILIRQAFKRAAGWPLLFGSKRYYYDGAAISQPRCCMIGKSTPQLNDTHTALEGGTIIDGSLFFDTSSGVFKSFGVDVGSASDCSPGDGLKVKAAFTAGLGGAIHTEDVITLLKSVDSPHHAHLYENFRLHTGGNLTGVHGFFGAVFKNSLTQLSSIYTLDNNESGSYFKSDASNGSCVDVQVGSIRCDGALQFGVRILSDGASLRRVQIGKIAGKGNAKTVQIQNAFTAGVDLRDVEIQSILSEGATVGDLCVDSEKSGGSIFNVDVGTLTTIGSLGKGVLTEGAGTINHLRVGRAFINYDSSATQETMDAAVDIMARVNSSNLGDITIVQNYGNDIAGSIVYRGLASNSRRHRLGSALANVTGSGRPVGGYFERSVSGTTAQLLIDTPRDTSNSLTVGVTQSSPSVVTSVAPSPGTSVPDGTTLVVVNRSSYDLTMRNTFPGTLLNSNGGDVIIAPNSGKTWVNIGDVFREVV